MAGGWPRRFGIAMLVASQWVVAEEADLSTFKLHPALEISLFAAEPDIVDPVALTFDEWGRAYVVEMRDYPYGFGPERRPGGTVRRLEDTDGDGRADRSIVFAEGLSFPTSITAWDQGVLVTAPPEILYLRDTDGDGVADRREVVLEGFELGVTDSNVNGLRWGLDNWIHAANGGNGGSVRFPGGDGTPVPLGNRDFRFRPVEKRVELTAGTGGGFGLVFDDWGRSFTTYNIDHIQQRVADEDLFRRFSGLPFVATTHSISDHGEMARIYPVSVAVTRPNHPEQAGHFSAAGGMGYIGHMGWPAELRGAVLVCDVVGNLVHRDRLVPAGAVFKATRVAGEQVSEFLAGTDPQFRPVGLEMGPDGALYLIDMQRAVIEHPDYIPLGKREGVDLRAGAERGRIYRVAPRGWTREEELPGARSAGDLVSLLSSPNAWTRGTAQRLLVEAGDGSVRGALVRVLRESDHPRARLHALWTLEGLRGLAVETLLPVLTDPDAGVRENAVRLVRERPPDPRFFDSVVKRMRDPEIGVRFQAALTLGHVAGDRSVAGVLAELLKRDYGDPWMRRAAMSSLPADGAVVLAMLLEDPRFRDGADAAARGAVGELSGLAAARLGKGEGEVLATLVSHAADGELGTDVRVALLTGLSGGLSRGAGKVAVTANVRDRLRRLLKEESRPLISATWRLMRTLNLGETELPEEAMRLAIRDAMDRSLGVDARVEAVELIGFGAPATVIAEALRLLKGIEPSRVQRAALELLLDRREPEVGRGLVAAWPAVAPMLRSSVVNLLVYRHAFHPALLDALESGDLHLGELNLDLEHRRELLRESDPEVRRRAARLMTEDEYSNRAAAVASWLGRLPEEGDAAAGRAVFERVCAQCHVAGGVGSTVGPELSGMSHRSVEDLLSNILDPNMAMNPAYVSFTAELNDGEEETGILGGETGATITLLQAQGRTVELRRADLRRLRANGRSLMPEGLEAGLSAQGLRDLIAFLQDSR